MVSDANLPSDPAVPVRMMEPQHAVLIDDLRKVTQFSTGSIAAVNALTWGKPPAVKFVNWNGMHSSLRLGNEQPFYEVAFRGTVFRMLARVLPEIQVLRGYVGVPTEVIRTLAPGLTIDGWLGEAPQEVPNTPISLLKELQCLTGADADELLSDAFSIYHFRLQNRMEYPTTLMPEGYCLRRALLLATEPDGKPHTFYDTPKGTNSELWSLFLIEFDRGFNSALDHYVNSRMASLEFGEHGALAMREAYRLRWGSWNAAPNQSSTRFTKAFGRKLPGLRIIRRISPRWSR